MTEAKKTPSQTAIPASWMMPAEATTASAAEAAGVMAPRKDGAAATSKLWYLLPLVAGFGGAILFASLQPRSGADLPPPPDPTPAAPTPASVDSAEAALRPAGATTPPPAPTTPTPPLPTAAEVGALEAPAPLAFELKELPVHKKIRKLVLRAESYLRKEEFNEAERVLKQAMRLDPNYPLPYRTLGIVRARDENYEGARWAYQKYLKLAPHAPDAPDVRRILGQ